MPGERDEPRRVQCGTCGRGEDCSRADVVRFSLTGWPRCCGEVMFLLTSDDPSTPALKPTPPPVDERRTVRLAMPRWFRASVRAADGPELAVGVVDVSAGGLGVRLSAELLSAAGGGGEPPRPGGGEPIRRTAEVRWCLAAGDGTFQAGLQF